MMRVDKAFSCCLLAGVLSTPLLAETRLTGRVKQYSSYFTESKRLRHQRYELQLKQTTDFLPQLTTTLEGRLWFDAALYQNSAAPYHDIDRTVRDDEMTELDLRQAFLDYLSSGFSLKLGWQQIDWIDSLSPRTSDVITPLDLRHGGFGAANQIIEPLFAALFNHGLGSFMPGTLEWMIVPEPKHHRLPKGENGYGYVEAIHAAGISDAGRSEDRPPRSANDIEAGLRYLLSVENRDVSFLAYRGHQRSPAVRLTPRRDGSVEWMETYPRLNTFGAMTSYSSDALVLRGFAFYEPERHLPIFRTLYEEPFENRTRTGLGFDYVFSKDLKIYSEHIFDQLERYYTTAEESFLMRDGAIEKRKSSWTTSWRLTNETFDDVLLSLDAAFSGPKAGSIVSPSAALTFASNYKAILGANIIDGKDSESAFYLLRKSSQVYLSLEAFF